MTIDWQAIRETHRMLFGLLAVLSLLACRSDRPYADVDLDALVSDRPDQPWRPTPDDQAVHPFDRSDDRESTESNSADRLPLDSIPPPPFRGEQTSLLRLIDFALGHRPDTRAAWERARVAAAELGIAQGAWYPVLGVEAQFYYARMIFPANGFALEADQTALIPQVALNYLLLDFGRREADDDAARAGLFAANLTFNRSLQQTIREVQVGYFNLDAALALNDASQRNANLAETVLEMVESQVMVGLATTPDLLLARQEMAQARFDLEATVADILSARADLLEACGVPANLPIKITRITERDLPEALEYRVDDVINVALRGRPDLGAALENVRRTAAGVRRAEADFLPVVNAFAIAGFEWTEWNTGTDRPVDGKTDFPSDTITSPVWNVGVSASWILFEGYIRENAVKAARAERRAAQAELEALRLRAIGETWDAYFRVQAYRRQYDFGIALVESSEEAFAAVSAAYREGLATITTLVQSERDLQASQATFVGARADLLIAAADLAFAAGMETGRTPMTRIPGDGTER
ncbi:MAG: TolC family protein [Phycisphaerales bacterium]|nr:TolC family protein [Phycisphaerales bacterium]